MRRTFLAFCVLILLNARMGVKIFMNFVIPFTVSSVSAMVNRNVR